MGDRPLLVSTILTGPERCRVDAVGSGTYEVVHRDSIEQVLSDVRVQGVRRVIVSVDRCQSADAPRLEAGITRIVRDFPRVAALALLSQATHTTPSALLLLGRTGIRTIADARSPEGWRTLRIALAARDADGDVASAAATQLAADLCDAPADCRRFFLTLFSLDESVARVAQLGRLLAVEPSTLISRFARRALPSPKIYLAWARLVRAAALLEQPGVSLSAATTALEYSSPQAFSRHLRLLLGLRVSVFRYTHSGTIMLARFRQELVLRYLGILNRFSPLHGAGCGTHDPTSRR